jgi:hypothetical protein
MQINGGFETSIILISTPPFWEGQMPIAQSNWVSDIQMGNNGL